MRPIIASIFNWPNWSGTQSQRCG